MTNGSTQDEFQSRLLELFLENGIRDLTVGEIAARLHCSRRRLYEVAQSKEGLFCAMAERFFSAVLAEGNELVAKEPDLTVALTSFLNVGVRAGARLSVAFLRDVDTIDAAREVFDRYQQARTERLAQLIDAGVGQGVFTPCHGRVVSEIILGAALRLRRPAFLARAGLTIEEAFDEFYRVLLDGLLLRQTARAPAPGARGVDVKVHKRSATKRRAEATSGLQSEQRARQTGARSRTPAPGLGQEPSDDVARLLIKAWHRD